jgi:hypothetical protein
MLTNIYGKKMYYAPVFEWYKIFLNGQEDAYYGSKYG